MGFRVIKTAAAALLAVYTAVYAGLEPPLSAGLLAILGVETTRMKGLRSVAVRFLASLLGLLLASAIFETLGYAYWTLGLFILIVFPVLAKLQLQNGIVTSAVIVFHVFASGEATAALMLNETLLLATGLGWATAINFLYMPKEDDRLAVLKEETERLFGEIFSEMALTLRDPAHLWDGRQLLAAENAVSEGSRLAEAARENRPWNAQLYWNDYFHMRTQQFESVEYMIGLIAFVYEKLPQAELVADVFDRLSEDIKSEVYTGKSEEALTELTVRFRGMPLPGTREQFEVRAALLSLCRELERCLAVAKRWKRKKLPTALRN